MTSSTGRCFQFKKGMFTKDGMKTSDGKDATTTRLPFLGMSSYKDAVQKNALKKVDKLIAESFDILEKEDKELFEKAGATLGMGGDSSEMYACDTTMYRDESGAAEAIAWIS